MRDAQNDNGFLRSPVILAIGGKAKSRRHKTGRVQMKSSEAGLLIGE
jgi:hypothetical protein